MYENDDSIRELRDQGLGCSEISRQLNISRHTVYDVLKRLDDGGGKYLKKKKAITGLREQGKTYQEIADELGLTRDAVERFCQRNGLKYSAEELHKIESDTAKRICGWNKGKTKADWLKKVDAKYNGTFKLVSIGDADEKNERYLIVECLSCGTQKRVSSQSFKGENGKHGYCEYCKQKRNRVERQLKEQNDEFRLEKTKIKKRLKDKQVGFRFCKCGAILAYQCRVCSVCRKENINAYARKYNKIAWRNKDIKRRSRIKNGRRDTDITLEKLYERDKGICYLCGCTCDWNDYKMINETFVVGGSYPSVEHVTALCNGGTHTWDNVKLACWSCNTRKGRKVLVS